MFRIRKEQIEAFRPAAEADFAVQMVDYLRQKHPQVIVKWPQGLTLLNRMSEEALLQLVNSGISRAHSHSFTWSSSISAFIVLMFNAAPNFDEHPTISALLNRTTIEHQRLARLVQEVPSTVWEEVKNNYDPASWTKQSGVVG